MAAVLVDALKLFNNEENRNNTDLDQPFIKALIIGICTKKSIQSGEDIHKDLLIFIKGKYTYTFQ